MATLYQKGSRTPAGKAPVKSATPKSKWGARLRKASDTWKTSEEAFKATFGSENLPEDVYAAKLQDCLLAEQGKDNKLVVKREHVITEGEFKGIVLRDSFQLENEWGPVFLRRWLNMLGVEVPENPEELEDLIPQVKEAAPEVKIRVKRNDQGFVNVDVIALIGENDGVSNESDGGEDDEEVDLDSMNKEELRALVKDNDLQIEGYRKLSEEDLRTAIAKTIGSGKESDDEDDDDSNSEESGEEGVDLDALDKEGLLSLIKNNGIEPSDLGFKNKQILDKTTEKDLRKAIEKYMTENGGGEDDGGSDADDELLEQAKVFCAAWDVTVAEDADINDMKQAIGACEFPEKELDEDDTALLAALELTTCIKKSRTS